MRIGPHHDTARCVHAGQSLAGLTPPSAHRATLARIVARAALESDAASDLQIGEAV